VFDFEYDFFDESYRETFEQHFIDHFYTREIGNKAPQLFKHFLKRTFHEKLPLYNEMFRTAAIQYDKVNNTSIVENNTRSMTGDNTYNGENNSNLTGTGSGTETATRRNLDTPQGSVDLVDDYLSNASKDDNSSSNQSSSTGKTTQESTAKMSSSESKSRSIEGHSNVIQADMLKKHIELQKELQRIELNFFEECNELFMLIY
jgi:hypothetical protein